eukprot:197400-Amorphochlora_amoeboformis.AAC.2
MDDNSQDSKKLAEDLKTEEEHHAKVLEELKKINDADEELDPHIADLNARIRKYKKELGSGDKKKRELRQAQAELRDLNAEKNPEDERRERFKKIAKINEKRINCAQKLFEFTTALSKVVMGADSERLECAQAEANYADIKHEIRRMEEDLKGTELKLRSLQNEVVEAKKIRDIAKRIARKAAPLNEYKQILESAVWMPDNLDEIDGMVSELQSQLEQTIEDDSIIS